MKWPELTLGSESVELARNFYHSHEGDLFIYVPQAKIPHGGQLRYSRLCSFSEGFQEIYRDYGRNPVITMQVRRNLRMCWHA